MAIQDYKFDFAYYKKFEHNGSLNGPDEYSMFGDDLEAVIEFAEKATALELIEMFVYLFREEYPNFMKLMNLVGDYEDEPSIYRANKFDNNVINAIEWKYYEEEKYSEYWGGKLLYKFYLEQLTMEFTSAVTDAKSSVISALGDKRYQLTSMANAHTFIVADSPIASVELRDKTFILKINPEKTYNYLADPYMLELGFPVS